MIPIKNTEISSRSWKLLDRLWLTTGVPQQIVDYLEDAKYWSIHEYALRITASTVASFAQDQRVKHPGDSSGYIFRMMQRRRADGLYHYRPPARTNAKSVLRAARSNRLQRRLREWRAWFPKRHEREVEFNRAKQVLQALAAKWDETVFLPDERVDEALLKKLLIEQHEAEEIMKSLRLLRSLIQFQWNYPIEGGIYLGLEDREFTTPLSIRDFCLVIQRARIKPWNTRSIRAITKVPWYAADRDRLIKLAVLLQDVI